MDSPETSLTRQAVPARSGGLLHLLASTAPLVPLALLAFFVRYSVSNEFTGMRDPWGNALYSVQELVVSAGVPFVLVALAVAELLRARGHRMPRPLLGAIGVLPVLTALLFLNWTMLARAGQDDPLPLLGVLAALALSALLIGGIHQLTLRLFAAR